MIELLREVKWVPRQIRFAMASSVDLSEWPIMMRCIFTHAHFKCHFEKAKVQLELIVVYVL